MSNNPFLQSKKQNNFDRFNFLDSEEPNKKSYIKDKKNNYPYSSSNNNSFTKSSAKNNERKQIEHTTNNKNHFREITTIPTTEFTITDELFPLLTPIVAPSKNKITNFKDALNQHNEHIVDEDITLRPGWVQISKINNKIVINQANIGPYDIKMQQMQQLQQLQEDPNYIMNQIMSLTHNIWLKHKTIYDNIHGEGAYDDLYYLPPVYDSDYDTDCDSQFEDDIDESEDY